MAYVKNCNPGTIRMDLPRANYIYELPLLSFGDVHGSVNLSLIFNYGMKAKNSNPFYMTAGYKLNLQKRLVMENGYPTALQENDGNSINFTNSSSPYLLDDDSHRVLRLIGSTYVLENSDYSTEYYDQTGKITSVRDKYSIEVLSYSYDSNGRLSSIKYRGNKTISINYDVNNRLATIIYSNSGNYIPFSYVDSVINIAHFSGARYALCFTSEMDFSATATATENSSTATYTTKLEKNDGTIVISSLVGSNTVDSMTYDFPISITSSDTFFEQVEITDYYDVRSRMQFKEKKLLYSYEIGTEDVAFTNGKYMGNVQIHNVFNHASDIYTGGTQTAQDGTPMTLTSTTTTLSWKNSVTLPTTEGDGYIYVLSGWMKLPDDQYSNDYIPLNIEKDGGASHISFKLPKPPIGRWAYFAVGFPHNQNNLHAYFEKYYGNIETKDVRFTLQATSSLANDDTANLSVFKKVLIYHNGAEKVYIPILGPTYACGSITVPDGKLVFFEDLLRYKLNQRKNVNTTEFYYDKGKGIIVATSAPSATVTHNGSTYNLSDCYLGMRQFTRNGIITTRIRDDDTNACLVYETLDNADNILSTQRLDEHFDVVSSTVDGVTTVYVREDDLITSESVAGLYTRTTDYGSNTVKVTDEFGKETTYTLDSVWGVIESVTLPDGTVITDTYDDDMCTLTNRTFGSTSGRSNALTYTRGNMTRLKTGDLYYDFSYSKGKLTGVQKNGSQIETRVHSDTTVRNYYPHGGEPLHSIRTIFDKYRHVTSIAGVLTNTYDMKPSFSNTTGALQGIGNGKDAYLAMTTDEIRGETARFKYNDDGTLAEKQVTDKADYAEKISQETFAYDTAKRLKTHTDTYDVAGNKSVSSVINYTKTENAADADNTVRSYAFKVNGAQKSVVGNTFDAFKRLQTKTIAMGSNTISKTFTYNNTRVKRVAETLAGANIGTNSYVYDNNGRIQSDSYSSQNITSQYKRYQYDQYGQLVREDNEGLAKTFVYCYNTIGNLTSVKEYPYTLNTTPSGDYTEQVYTYKTTPPDRMASFAGKTIGYNVLGQPVSYDGKNYDWSKGKLSRIFCGDSSVAGSLYESCTFTYNGYGQRVAKSYAIDPDPGSNSDYSYTYNTSYQYDHFGRLIREYCDERYIGGHTVKREFIYLYDESGMIGVMYSLNGAAGTRYYYKRNLQGDVIALYDENGVRKVEYLYDAWGNCTTIYGAGTDLAKSNPIRYRGYYFDRETGLYYLNARYYNPQWRRFISPATNVMNANAVNGLNVYVYAGNDPVNIVYRSSNTNGKHLGIACFVGITELTPRENTNSNLHATNRNLPAVPEWGDPLSTALDHAFSVVNPIRTAAATLMYTNLWDVMRLDGVTELPGTLSRVATGVGWGLGIIGGVVTGYEKYASGASVSSSIAGGIINAGVNIGGMYAASAIASWGIGLLVAGTALPGGAIVLIGAATAILLGVAINHALTKWNVGGNTIEGHLNDFVDWLIFWD